MSRSREDRLPRLASPFARAVLVLVVGFLFIWPVVMLLIGMFRSAPPGVSGTWTTSAVRDAFGEGETWSALRNSLVYASIGTALATLIGGSLAFLSTRTTIPLRRIITPVMIMVLAAPNVLYAISWALLADPSTGLLNRGFRGLTGTDITLLDAYSWPALILVQSLKLSGFAYLLLLGPFSAMSRTLEDASLVASGRIRTLFRIDLPLLTPSLFGVVIIGAVYGMGAFDVPLILGDPAGITVLSTQIYKDLNAFPAEYAQASSLGLFMIAALLVLLAVQWKVLRAGRFTTITGKGHRQDRWDLGRAGWACSGALAVFVLVALVLPGVQLVLTSLQPAIGVNDFSFDNYDTLLSSPLTERIFRTSIWLALLGGLAAMVTATVLAYVARHSRPAMQRYLDSATLVPIVMPGVVLALGLLWAYVTVPGLRELYATYWLAILGLIVVVMPVASRSVSGALTQISNELEEAAAVSGVTRTKTLRDIVAPLIARSFFVGWLVTAVMIVGMLDVPLLLLPATEPNVAVRVYTLMFSAGEPTQASALLVMLMAIVVGAAAAFFVLSRIARAIWLRQRTAAAIAQLTSPPTPQRIGQS